MEESRFEDFREEGDHYAEFATFGQRLGAHLIDGIIIGVIMGIAIAIFAGSIAMAVDAGSGISQEPNPAILIPFLIFVYAAPLFYYAYMESSEKQATFGKRAVGIKVVHSKYGERISFGRAFGRIVAKLFLSGILLIGYIMAAFTEEKQALHDMVASTHVIKS